MTIELGRVMRPLRRRKIAGGAAAGIALAMGLFASADSERQRRPEEVALKYRQAIYATNVNALRRLLSSGDRRAKDPAGLRSEHPERRGLAGEMRRLLAGYIAARSVHVTIAGDRARVGATFLLPDANAPQLRALMRDWDDDALHRLALTEQARLALRIIGLHRDGTLPILSAEETIDLVRESGAWKVSLGWADSMRASRRAHRDHR